MFEFSVVPGTAIKAILEQDQQRSIAVVKEAYLDHHRGHTVNPDSYFLRFPKAERNRIIALPAAIDGDFNVSGIKWIASFPANIERGIPRASALLVLNDQETGYPFACLEASLISAVRTAASAVLGAYWINGQSRRARSVAFVGAGVIARNILDMFIADHWEIGQVVVHDSDSASCASFAAHAQAKQACGVAQAPGLAAALEADIVVFATNAGTPYVRAPLALRPGQIVLNISLRDLAPELILAANNLFDDVDHCMKASTSPHLAEQMCGNRGFSNGTLAQLMLGETALDGAKPTIYSPFGMGMLDLALGKRVFDLAVAAGKTVPIDGFFGETSRW